MIRLGLLAIFVALALNAPGASAAETVWSGLVHADNVPQPAAIPPELSGIEQTLKELFGYNQFQIIGQSRNTLTSAQEHWGAWSRYFTLQVEARGRSAPGYILNLKLFKEKELLLETEAKLSKQRPLLVKGPQVGGGQLLLVLLLQ